MSMRVPSKKTWTALAVALTIAAPAFAADFDWSPSTERILSDPAFRPTQGQVVGNTAISTRVERAHDYFSRTGQRGDNKVRTNTVSQDLEVGVTDWLSLTASGAYSQAQFEVNSSIGPDKQHAEGFANPAFGLSVRALDQRTQPVNVDVRVSYAPDLLTARFNTDTGKGSVARGGDATTLSTSVSRQMKSLTVEGFVSATRFGEADTEYRPSNNRTDVDTFYSGTIGINTQTRLSQTISADLGASYTAFTDAKQHTTSGTDFNVEPADLAQVSAGLNYHIIPNRLVAGVRYAHTFVGDTTVTGGTDVNIDSDGADTFQFNLRYSFF